MREARQDLLSSRPRRHHRRSSCLQQSVLAAHRSAARQAGRREYTEHKSKASLSTSRLLSLLGYQLTVFVLPIRSALSASREPAQTTQQEIAYARPQLRPSLVLGLFRGVALAACVFVANFLTSRLSTNVFSLRDTSTHPCSFSQGGSNSKFAW